MRKAWVVLGVLIVSAGVAQESGTAVREALLRHVRVIDSGGVPGVVLCVGSNAFPVVAAKCGQAVQPVAAAAHYGKGRVLALGHPSFLTPESLPKGDTAAFLKNGLAWLGQGKSAVAVYKNGGIAKALSGFEGYSVREIPSLDALAAFPVLAANPDSLHPDEIERVRAHLLAGGGLLASGIGWGWQQVSGGKSLATENLFNRLLGPAGLLISGDIADRTAPDGYLAAFDIPAGVNASEAVRLASSGTVTDAAALRQINHSLCAAKAVLPPAGSDLSQALDALMQGPGADKVPLPGKPLSAADIPARLKHLDHQRAWQARPFDRWPAHPSAVHYPGQPPAGTPLTGRTLTVGLDIPRWHSTGLFAVAGQPVTVELPASAIGLGLRLRIGATTCDNTRHDTWQRAPKVDMEVPLTADKVTVSSPFGGLLYVVVPDPVKSAERTVKVTVRDACRAPWFKVGRDSLVTWKTSIRSYPAPWAELESDKLILTVPTPAILTLDDPAALLAFWDKVADQDARLTAIDPEGLVGRRALRGRRAVMRRLDARGLSHHDPDGDGKGAGRPRGPVEQGRLGVLPRARPQPPEWRLDLQRHGRSDRQLFHALQHGARVRDSAAQDAHGRGRHPKASPHLGRKGQGA